MGERYPTYIVERWIAVPVQLLMVCASIATLVWRTSDHIAYALYAWVLLGLVFLGRGAWHLRMAALNPEKNDIQESELESKSRTWGGPAWVDGFVTIAISLLGLLCAVPVLTGWWGQPGSVLDKAAAVLAIFVAWMFLQIAFTVLYAQSYYGVGDGSGLDFPKTEEPGLMEFFYFTFSIGATFQTSDTDVTSTHMRYLVTIHATLNWLFNTIIIALAVQVISG